MSSSTSRVSPERPFLGLNPYTEQEQAYFHGRDNEIDQLIRCIRRDALTTLFGRSGLGKTSLIEAGVFPRLRAEGYIPVRVRIDFSDEKHTPLQQTRAAIGAAWEKAGAAEPMVGDEGSSLWELLHASPFVKDAEEPRQTVIVFDQFEEVFTRHGLFDGPVRAFIQELADLTQNRIPATVRMKIELLGVKLPERYADSPARVVIALREDFVPQLQNFDAMLPNLMRNRMRLIPMAGIPARDAMRAQGGDLVDEEVATAIIRFVSRSGLSSQDEDEELEELYIEPFLLSLVCQQLNERRIERGESRLTKTLLDQMGDQVLTAFYVRSTVDLGPAAQLLVEEHLITKDGFRTLEALQDALQLEGVTEELIGTLVDRKLIRRDDRLNLTHLELVHDVMAPVVKDSRDARLAAEAEKLAAAAREREEEEAARRREAEEQQAEYERKRKRAYRRTVALVAAMLAIGGVSLHMYNQAQEAEALRQEAVSAREEMARSAEELAENNEQLVAERALRVRVAARASESQAQSNLAAGRFPEALESALSAYQDLSTHAGESEVSASLRLLLGQVMGTLQSRRERTSTSRPISCMALGPNGRWFAAGEEIATPAENPSTEAGAEGGATRRRVSLLLWDRQQGAARQLEGHEKQITSLAFDPSGRLLTSASLDGKIRIWDCASGKVLHVLDAAPTKSPARSVIFIEDGKKIVSTSWGDSHVRLWDAETGELLRTLATAEVDHHSSAVSPDGAWLAAPREDGSVVLCNLRDPDAKPRILAGSESALRCAAFDSTSALLATGDALGLTRIWDVATGTEVSTNNDFPDVITKLLWVPGKRRLLVAGNGDYALMVGADSGETIFILPGHLGRIHDMVLAGPGRVLTADAHGVLRRFDLRTRSMRWSRQLSFGALTSLSYNATRQEVLAGGKDGSLTVIDTSREMVPRQRIHMIEPKRALAISPDGLLMVASNPSFGAEIRSVTSVEEYPRLRLGTETRDTQFAVFSDTGEHVLTVDGAGQVHTWSALLGEPVGEAFSLGGGVTSLIRLRDGRFAATTESGEFLLWDGRRSAEAVRRLELPAASQHAPVELADGRVACFGEDAKLRVIGLPGADGDLSVERTIDVERRGDEETVALVEGGHLLWRRPDGQLELSSPVVGDRRFQIEGDGSLFAAAAGLPESDSVAIGWRDGRITVVSAKTGAVEGAFESRLGVAGIRAMMTTKREVAAIGGAFALRSLGVGRRSLTPHDVIITSIEQQGGAIEPGGDLIGTCKGNEIRIYTVDENGITPYEADLVLSLPEEAGLLLRMAFTPDGREVIAGDLTGAIWKWPIYESKRIPQRIGHARTAAWGLEFVGDKYVSLSSEGVLRIWEMGNPDYLHSFYNHDEEGVYDLATSSKGLVATSGLSGGVVIRDLERPQSRPRTLRGGDAWGDVHEPYALAFSGDGSRMVVGDSAGRLHVYRTDTFERVHSTPANELGVAIQELRFSPDDKTIITGHVDASLQVWDVKTLDIVATGGLEDLVMEDRPTGLARLRVNPASGDVLAIYNGSQPRIWRADHQAGLGLGLPQEGARVKRAVYACRWSRDGQRLLLGQGEGTLVLRDLDGEVLRMNTEHETRVTAILEHELDGQAVVLTCDSSGRVLIWDAADLSRVGAVNDPELLEAEIVDMDLHPDGKKLVTASAGGICRIWAFGRDEPVCEIEAPIDPARIADELEAFEANALDAKFDPTGKWLATGWGDGRVRIWPADIESDSQRPSYELDLNLGNVWSSVFSADGTRLLGAGEGGAAVIWSTADWRPITRLAVEDTQLTFLCAVFHPDGSLVATGASTGLVHVWDAETGALVLQVPGHDAGVMDLHWSPDGRKLLSAGLEGDSLIYELPFEYRSPAEMRRLADVALGLGGD